MSRKPRVGAKQKVRKAAAKRVKITATGKVLMRQHNMRHLMRHKSKKAKRASRIPLVIKGKFATRIKQMLQLA